MNIIGFFFSKVHAHKSVAFKKGLAKTTNIDVINIEEQESPFNTKDAVLKINFRYQVIYAEPSSKKEESPGEVTLEGVTTMMMSDEESKELLKEWKKKEVPTKVKQGLFNFILRKCSPKALEMEDEVQLPYHIPLPQVNLNINPSKK